MRIAKYCFMALILPLSVGGCQKGSGLKTARVSGQVTLGGQPVEGATVSFLPKDSTTGHTAMGITNAEGRYELETFESPTKPIKGVVAGDYDVTITKYETANAMTPEQIDAMRAGNATPEQMQKMSGVMTQEQKSAGEAASSRGTPEERAAAATGGSGPKMMLPKKYSSPTDSGLSATVAADQKTPIDFQLSE